MDKKTAVFVLPWRMHNEQIRRDALASCALISTFDNGLLEKREDGWVEIFPGVRGDASAILAEVQ